MEYRQALKIPKDRVAVLIGEKGQTKREIEQQLSLKLDIDSEEGDVVLRGEDTIKLFTGQELVKAVARGFNPEIAKLLLRTDYMLELLPLQEYARSKGQIRRLKGRVIGENGKSRETIEQLSGTYLSVYGKTVGIIGEVEAVNMAQRAIDMLLTGAPHSTVFRILERWRREQVHRELDPTR